MEGYRSLIIQIIRLMILIRPRSFLRIMSKSIPSELVLNKKHDNSNKREELEQIMIGRNLVQTFYGSIKNILIL